MKKQHLFALWGGLFALCAGLGFIGVPSAALQILMAILSALFFLPAAVLLYRSRKCGDRDTVLLVRNLSVASLVLTAALIIANFLSALAPAWLGNFLHGMLVVVSVPMICSGNWALSLFLWACLMIVSMKILKEKQNP